MQSKEFLANNQIVVGFILSVCEVYMYTSAEIALAALQINDFLGELYKGLSKFLTP